jgi:hypothetical protein
MKRRCSSIKIKSVDEALMEIEKKKKNGKNVSERTHTRSGMKRKFADVRIRKRKKRRPNTRKTRLV